MTILLIDPFLKSLPLGGFTVQDDELILRYGTNPHQLSARALVQSGPLPFAVLNGSPGYINLLDALNSWQLVRELKSTIGMPAAASFKHVSPAGVGLGTPLSTQLEEAYFVGGMELSPLATAYARARGADRISSFGDWVALNEPVDISTARLLRREVSDGVIAPAYEPAALELLKSKQGGRYCILEIDAGFEPSTVESRDVFGVTLEQQRNDRIPSGAQFQGIQTRSKELPANARRDLLIALTTLKYTQSNSMCLAYDGQVIGVGAGQQSRIHCTRLAASKADLWYLRQHPVVLGLRFRESLGRPERDNAIDGFLREDLSLAEDGLWQTNFDQVPQRLTASEKREWLNGLTGVSLGSDAFIPFRDNVDRAAMSGVKYIVQPGGSVRDESITAACDEYGIVMAMSGVRLFHH